MLALVLSQPRSASGLFSDLSYLRRRWFGLGLAAALLCIHPGLSRADENSAYGDRVKVALRQILQGREFKPSTGCDKSEICIGLMARLRAGDFTVIEPIERSERPDMPSYRRIRNKCAKLDPVHLRAARHINVATRNFAMYKLDIPKHMVGGDEVLVFRGQHYVPTDGKTTAGNGGGSHAVWPGMFVAMGYPSCRQFSGATSQEGDQRARHNAVGEDDYLSEIVTIGNRFYVLNLDPIAGPNQPKAMWWYDLELWDWGPRADADMRRSRHVYTMSYRPVSVSVMDTGTSSVLAPRP